MVKNVHPDPADLGSAANQAGTSSTTEESEKNNGMQSRRGKRITWTREQMISIAPQCKDLPECLGVIPDDMSALFHMQQPASARTRAKGRPVNSFDAHGRKRVEDSVRSSEKLTSGWRRKDRPVTDVIESSERYVGQARCGGESAWRPRRETNDDGIWNATSPSAAGAADGWLMPDADEEYELGGSSNNIEAFEAMRQQARAEWAKSKDVKSVQDSETEVLMKDLIAEARDDASTATERAPPGLKSNRVSPAVEGVQRPVHKIDVQSLFNGVLAAPPGLTVHTLPKTSDSRAAETGTVAYRPQEGDMRSTLSSVPGVVTEELTAHEAESGHVERQHDPEPKEGPDHSAQDISLVSGRKLGREVDVGSLFNDGGIDDAMPGFSLEDVPISHDMPRTSSPPPSSPKHNIWGPTLDDGATGSMITSTDWTQMQEIWKREPATSKPLEADSHQPMINDGFVRDRIAPSAATAVSGITQAHSMLGDAMSYGGHSHVGVPAAQLGKRDLVDPIMGLTAMSLLPASSSEKHVNSMQMRPAVSAHPSHSQATYGNATVRQPQQMPSRQLGHAVPQPRVDSADPHSFEIYLKQLVANAQQQQQQQITEQQRVQQGALGSRAAVAGATMHARGPSLAQTAVSNQQASMEQIRKLAPAFQLTNAAVPQQRHIPVPAARQPHAASSYSTHAPVHRAQDPSWMLRQLKVAGSQQVHATIGTTGLQHNWASPSHVHAQVQYPSSAYDRRGQQAAMQQLGGTAHTSRSGLQQTHAALQGVYAEHLTRAALQSARQAQQQSGLWLPQTSSQAPAYPSQVLPAQVHGVPHGSHRGAQYAVQSSLPRYYADNTQPGYTTMYRQ